MEQIQQLHQKTFIGLDTHKETIFGTALDEQGKVLWTYEFANDQEAFSKFLEGTNAWNAEIAIEACGIWRGCYRILSRLGYKVKLANPLKVHEIASCKKTDKKDSEILADLLRTGYLPEVYIPSEEILKLRDITRHKCNLTRLRVRLQNKIKGYLLREGIKFERKLWNNDNLSWLELNADYKLQGFLNLYKQFKKEEQETLNRIKAGARMRKETNLIATIPGIAEFGASMIYAEIGDIKRFPSVKHLHAYAGVAPGIYQSGSKSREAYRKEVNKWLKWILIECTQRAYLLKGKFQNYYFKVKEKKGWKIARRATARKMLSIIYHVLKDEVPYRES